MLSNEVFTAHELTENRPRFAATNHKVVTLTRVTNERVVYITGSTCCSSVQFMCCEHALADFGGAQFGELDWRWFGPRRQRLTAVE